MGQTSGWSPGFQSPRRIAVGLHRARTVCCVQGKSKSKTNCIAPYYGMNPLLKRSDMARDSKGITQFYLPPTHEPYLPLLPSRRASPPLAGTHCAYPQRDARLS